MIFPRHLARHAGGGVTVLGALSLTVVVGMTGMAVEVGQSYAVRVSNQRVADAAALAAGLAYAAGRNASAIRPAAVAIARANGLSDAAVLTPAIATDAAGRTLVTVTIHTPVPLRLTRIVTAAPSYDVRATGVAAITTGTSANTAPGCILALSTAGGTGLAMNGGTSIAANGCAVNANGSILLTGGARLAAAQINTGGTASAPSGTMMTTSPRANDINQNRANAAVDPLASDARIAAALARVGSYTAPAAIGDPTTQGGPDWDFSYSPSNSVKAYRTSEWGGDYVVPAGTYRIGRLSIAGGVTVTFQGASTVTIRNGLVNYGNRLTIGNGSSWAVNGGLDSGYAGIAFGDSNVHVGSGTVTLNNTTFGDGDVAINGALTLGYGNQAFGRGRHSFAGISLAGGAHVTLGAGNLNVPGRIVLGGGARLEVGSGDTTIGQVDGNSITVDGGSTLLFGDGRFSTAGSVVTTSGGNSITFGATANHFIRGDLSLAGSARFGAGAYTVAGALTNGTGGSMEGTDITFFLSGAVMLSGGTTLNMQAPATARGDAIADLLFATRTTNATTLAGGANATLAGLWYAPNSPFTMDGGAGISSAGRCFMLFAGTLTLNGGTAAATACTGITGQGASATADTVVRLVR